MTDSPRSWTSVVETWGYLARAKRILSNDDRDAVVQMLAREPDCGFVMEGTGGIRKARFAIGDRGKSGGVRVVYYFHNHAMPVFLLTLFSKNEKANLTLAERNALAGMVDLLKRAYGK